MLRYREITADLFSVPVASLAHCVSADLAMSAGIASSFRSRFGNVDALRQQEGVVPLLRNDSGNTYTHVFYLVTKERHWHKPTYDSLYVTLITLQAIIARERVTSIALPLIGCGLDGLDWNIVREMLFQIFRYTDLEMTICKKPRRR